MKKVNKSSTAPALLTAYYVENPLDTWDNFAQTEQEGKLKTQETLRQDQYHLCAYCEIKLIPGEGGGNADFRVEHFHPKNRPPQPPPNWDLDWGNLLAVCHGGSVSTVREKTRCTTPDHSCDVPKGNQVLDGQILNPLTDIPAFPPLFDFHENGQMLVADTCPEALKIRAKETILKLRLSEDPSQKISATRLSKLRAAVIDELRVQVNESVEHGNTIEIAMTELAEIMFPAAHCTSWPDFFSTIRWYLGSAAEDRLKALGYSG